VVREAVQHSVHGKRELMKAGEIRHHISDTVREALPALIASVKASARKIAFFRPAALITMPHLKTSYATSVKRKHSDV
jgi:hypothetical protein